MDSDLEETDLLTIYNPDINFPELPSKTMTARINFQELPPKIDHIIKHESKDLTPGTRYVCQCRCRYIK